MIRRKINVENLTDEQLEAAVSAISVKVGEITQEAIKQANQLLARYGLECKMQIAFEAISDKSDKIDSEQNKPK